VYLRADSLTFLQYDRNAIRVNNVFGDQIGHLPRKVVEKITPYVVRRAKRCAIRQLVCALSNVPQDSGDIMLEAQLAGEKGFYDCPIKLFFYGPSNPAERSVLEEKLKRDKLVRATELKKTKKEAEARRRALGLVSGTSSHGLGSEPAIAQKPEKPEVSMATLLQNSEAIELRNGADAIKKLAIGEDQLEKLPKAEQPAQLKSQLLPYQLQVRLVIRSV
jgi:SWI/SNF-related matrix-associated actin-dependent regulator of chromatin subfamily A3